MEKTLDKPLIRKAIRHLKSSDKVIYEVIKKHGPCTITPALNNPFHALTSSIISQQLSAHAARAIKSRLFDLLGVEHFTPKNILKMSPKTSRAARQFQRTHSSLESRVRFQDGLAFTNRRTDSISSCVISRP